MKKFLFASLTLGIAAAAHAQLPTLTKIALWTNAYSGGSVQDVSFDGINVYLSRLNNTTAILSKLNITSAGAIATGVQNVGSTDIYTKTGIAASRGVRSAISGGNVFFGYDGAGYAGTNWGIDKVDTATNSGSLLVGSATSVNPANSGGNPSRIDTLDIDPLTGNLAMMAYGSGGIFRVDASTGAAQAPLKANSAYPQSQARDLAFASNGDVAARIATTNGGAAEAYRLARTSDTLTGAVTLLGPATIAPNFTSVITNVSGAGFGSFAAFNPTARTITLAAMNGSGTGTLTGLEDGFTTRFGSTFGLGSGTAIDGKSYLFVGDSSGNLHVYQVQAVPEPSTMAVLGLGALVLRRRFRRR